MQRFTIEGKGGQMAALNFGRASGPVDLVFLHATGFCARTYRHLLAPLGSHLRVVALDQRGHGHSTLPARPSRLSSWDTYAADAIIALRHLGRERPPRLIAGHSLGATVSLLALAAAPGLADALLMIDPPLVLPRIRRWLMLPFGPLYWRHRLPIARAAGRRRAAFGSLDEVLASYRGRGAFRSWAPGFLDDYVEDGFARHADGGMVLRCAPAWESATFTAQRHDLCGALGALETPGHVLVAEHASTAARGAHLVNRFAPRLGWELVRGASHFIPMEQPGLVRQRILALLENPAAFARAPGEAGTDGRDA